LIAALRSVDGNQSIARDGRAPMQKAMERHCAALLGASATDLPWRSHVIATSRA